ncbi:palmitoyltransferase, partial [Ascosphaera pollenicola]
MKLYYMGIWRNETRPAVELCGEKDLSSFGRFTRDSYGEFMTLFSCTVAERTRAGQRQDIEENSYTFHAYSRSEGICAIIISDQEYPKLVAHQILSKLADEFLVLHPRTDFIAAGTPGSDPSTSTATASSKSFPLSFPALKGYLIKYQDPGQADSIMKIQKELDETKIVLHSTIKSVLERGESIDKLVEKSDGLSWQSKTFYDQAKKQNSCCTIIHGQVREVRAYRSVSDPQTRHLFEYSSGRFLFNEQARLAERYVPFNVGALKFAITRSLGKKDTEPARFRKWMEGSFCRVLTVDFDDGEQVVVKIPYKSAIPRKLTTESEVATLDLLRCHDFPVPRVLCWAPDCDNEVGAAYIVMSQAKGAPLSRIWPSLTREEILPLMQSFVELEAKLFVLPFKAYGSIYYRDGIIPDAFQTDIFAPESETGDTQATKFCIGPLVERSFWRGKLFDMSMDRGP